LNKATLGIKALSQLLPHAVFKESVRVGCSRAVRRWETVMADDEEEEESERRTGLCILIHRQNRFCHRKCRPVLPVN